MEVYHYSSDVAGYRIRLPCHDMKRFLTVARVGRTVNSRCWTISWSSKGPRLSWLRSTRGFRQRANFSRAPDRLPAFKEAMPHACHTPPGSRPLLVDTYQSSQTSSHNENLFFCLCKHTFLSTAEFYHEMCDANKICLAHKLAVLMWQVRLDSHSDLQVQQVLIWSI